jgi:hypothetical protein
MFATRPGRQRCKAQSLVVWRRPAARWAAVSMATPVRARERKAHFSYTAPCVRVACLVGWRGRRVCFFFFFLFSLAPPHQGTNDKGGCTAGRPGEPPHLRPGQLEAAVEWSAKSRRRRAMQATTPLPWLWIIPRAMRIYLSSSCCSDTSRRYVPCRSPLRLHSIPFVDLIAAVAARPHGDLVHAGARVPAPRHGASSRTRRLARPRCPTSSTCTRSPATWTRGRAGSAPADLAVLVHVAERSGAATRPARRPASGARRGSRRTRPTGETSWRGSATTLRGMTRLDGAEIGAGSA